MKCNKLFFNLISLLMTIFGCSGCAAEQSWNNTKRIESSPQYKDGKFVNYQEQDFDFSISEAYKTLKAIYFTKQPGSIPETSLLVKHLTYNDFFVADPDAFRYTRLGHSSIMFQIGGKVWVTDPVFSDFITPFAWMGWKRFHPVPIDIKELNHIEGVIISHDHYDHLDKDVIVQLKDSVNHFIVPLGVGKRLTDWGVPHHKITTLDWWESTKIGDVEFTSTPAQHFSGRTPFDRNETLWTSWVVKSGGNSLYFSGDSGYFDGFKTIGEKYGPFDITFMECGQYSDRWKYIHMMPEETLQAHQDVQGQVLAPIHNSTFKISFHPWYDPMERITTVAEKEKEKEKEKIKILTPIIGEIIDINSPLKTATWWKHIL